uniref:Tudor domain containing 15 n=1 Tax=Cyclopterus lumpus TaxID=8103 RepID=A0A8C2WWJ6_CYCLU
MLATVNESRIKERNQKTPENLGLLCSVKGKDGKWYRGYVQFLPVNSQLRVLFIDYGFFESVNVENVYGLPPDLFSTTIMAFPCSLSSLSDEDEAVKTQQLNFLKAGLLGRVLDVEIRGFDKEQHLYSITVIGVEDNNVKEPEPIQELPSMIIESVSKEDLSPQCGYLYNETIMGKAMCKTLEAEGIHVNSVFVGFVVHVQNPSHFWIRTEKRNDEFEEMTMKMADTFSQIKLDEDVLLKPALGTLCCAVYEEDMHFYRGVVTDTYKHGSEVLFIDFGNIEKVPHKLIKKMPETFANKSAYAFCCTLVNVFPLDEIWTCITSDFFRQAVSNKPLLVHVVQMRKNKFVVDLHDMEKQLHCEKVGKTCKIETEKVQAPASFKALNIKPGCNLAVICSYIKSPSEFWCQPLDKHLALKELMDELQQYYSTHSVPLNSRGSCCIAKSPQDGRWYRAFVIEIQKSHARVMLVDYGFTIQIKEQNLEAIMPEYLYLEAQAFRCSLNNPIKPADPENSGDWSPAVCKELKDLVFNSTSALRCEVTQLYVKFQGLYNVVELYDTQTQQSLTNLLFKQSVPREEPISAMQLSTMIPESFVYSSHDLRPGNEEQVYITHVSSQCEIYCHLERNTEMIEELENKISDESEKLMQDSTTAVVRKLSLAKYFDGKWYRGLAHPVQSPLHLGVFFVDYGNTNISEKTHVMCIPRDSDLLYTPMQAVKCHLASVSKEKLCSDVREWLDGAILNKQLRVVVIGKREDGSFDVELFDGDQNEEMVPSTAETRIEEVEGEFNLCTSPPQQLFFAPIDIDKAYSGFAAAVTTPCEFCIVLEDLLLVMNKVSLILDDLPEQMSLPVAHLVPGTCCLFKSHTKNKWCRAEIADADTTAVLNLVDYGHYEGIPYEDCSKLKRLPEEMRNLPKVTYPCILRGVKPVGADGQWTDGAAVFFQQSLYQKNLQIFFRECVSNTHWKVDILAEGISLNVFSFFSTKAYLQYLKTPSTVNLTNDFLQQEIIYFQQSCCQKRKS